MSDAHEHPAVRVLIVDDEFVVRDFVSRTLRQAGYQTETASDGGVAVSIADAWTSPDLLVTDLKMPGMDGLSLAGVMQRQDPHLRVLFLTAYADVLPELDAAMAGRQAVLGKPCTVRELLHAVSQVLFGHIDGPSAR